MHTLNRIFQVAYLAPEIPATSATFVYNEILGLQELGLQVLPFSIHRPSSPATDPAIERLKQTVYLYEQPKRQHIVSALKIRNSFPSRSSKTASLLIQDMKEVGLFTAYSFKLVYQYLVAHTLAIELIRHHIQHLHIHFGHVPTQVGMYAAALADIPFTFTTHANDIFQRGLLLTRKAERAKKVVTISEYNRTYLHNIGIPLEKIAVVRCGVSNCKMQRKRKELQSIPVIGSLGRFVEKKGFDILIRACAILQNEGYKFKLQIAGFGPLLPQLIEETQRCGLADIVSFIGELSHERVNSWLQELDVFALASKRDQNGDTDGIPVVLMEAMAAGIPVVSTRIGGIPELIEHELSGLLCVPNDAHAFSIELKRLLSNCDLKVSLTTQAAHRKIESEFDSTLNIKRIYQIITK